MLPLPACLHLLQRVRVVGFFGAGKHTQAMDRNGREDMAVIRLAQRKTVRMRKVPGSASSSEPSTFMSFCQVNCSPSSEDKKGALFLFLPVAAESATTDWLPCLFDRNHQVEK